MMVIWTKVVADEWGDSSGCVDNLDRKCERKREGNDSAKILEECDYINQDEEVAGRIGYRRLSEGRVWKCQMFIGSTRIIK